jgi:gliding motility-associated-like protein
MRAPILKNVMNRSICLAFILVSLLSLKVSFAQVISVDNTQTEQQLISNHLVEGCVDVSNISSSVNGQVNGFSSFGYFERDLSNFPFENGIVLSTGNANSAGNTINTNELHDGSSSWGTDADLETALGIVDTENATSIEFDFVSVSNLIQFNYILASEEYTDTYPCDYSDGFAFLIRQAGTTSPYTNIALIPGTAIPVNTNTIHDEIVGFCDAENNQYFDGYTMGDTNFNGRTTVMTASASITPNVTYHIKLVIADQNDSNFDSAVFIQGNSFNPTVDLGPDVQTCDANYVIDGDIQNPLASYVWYRNGAVLSGENGTSISAIQSGTYLVEITIPLNGEDCVISDSIEVTLNSSQSIPPLNDMAVCDDASNDGIETFNLSSKDAEILAIMPPGNYNITYHFTNIDAQNAANAITNPIQNSSSPQTIYVRIIDTVSGCITFTTFNLIVNPMPSPVQPQPQQFCDDAVADGSISIDLSSYDDQITQGNTGLTVTYHYMQSDADNGINAIPLPYTNSNPNEIIYIRVEDSQTGCSATTSISIEVLDRPDVGTLTLPPLDSCEADNDGFEFFDLTEVIPDILAQVSGVSVTFHETQNDADLGINAIADETNYQNIDPNTQILFVRIEGSNGCATVLPLTLHTNLLITGTNFHDFFLCDDESADGIVEFNLVNIATAIVNNLSSVTVSFYETQNDADNDTNPIDQSVPYQVTSSPHTLYVKVETPDCERIETIELIILPPVILDPIPPIDFCDTDDDGFTSIELSLFDTAVSNGLTNVTVTYHLTQMDADSNSNALPPFYTNTVNPQTLFARVENSTSCFDTLAFDINVIPAPTVNQPNDIVICDDDQDALSIIDLESRIPEIVSDTTDLTISFHNTLIDANANTNQIVTPDNYNSATEIIYVRVESDITSCHAIVEINVIVNTQPAFIAITNFQHCETDGNQTADFLFNEKDAEILNGQTGKRVLYFETQNDATNRTNIIDKNSNYTNLSSPQTIYVRVENFTDLDCFGVSSFEIEVGSIPLFNPPTNFVACDDISNDGFHTFDLNEKITEISQGSPETLIITFYINLDDAENEINEIPLIYTNIDNPQQIYARIDNGTYCHAIAEFGLNVIQVPNVNLPTALEVCDNNYDGISTFDLTIAEFEILDIRNDDIIVTYFENSADLFADTNQIATPENYTNTENPQTVYVKVLNIISNCYVEVPLELIVNIPPEINAIPEIETCENDTFTFNLSEATTTLINDTTNVIVSYHTSLTDAQNAQNNLGSVYIYSTTSDTIFIRAEFSTTTCVAIQSFDLIVNPNPIANIALDMEACDDDFDFELIFNLEQQTPTILGAQSGLNYTVTYYETLVDAENNTNVIQNLNYNAYNGQEIFARLENNETGCFDTSSFFIIINRKPEIDIEDQVICLDNLPLTVSADLGFIDDSYLWSTGETTSEIDIDQIGDYWVTVTSIDGCETTSNFNVSESELATIEITETVDFSDPNNITITISGIGDYLYQLDDGEPQDSNVFENVSLGYHIVTVIDINGCGSVTTEVLVIDAPKFMTPNNDGYFDTWHIVGVETLPGTTIHIFDRYGKQLHYLTATSHGWDGTYNGKMMPASDYWYVANVVQGSNQFQVKGHFSIKR